MDSKVTDLPIEPVAQSSASIRLVEVFSSIQGEGILIGRRQVFVRTFGCNIRCSYCDSPETLKESGSPANCRIERGPGSCVFDSMPNPISASKLTQAVASYLDEPHHSLSITGGEPLLHSHFLRSWLPEVRGLGLPVFLETNGLLADHLNRIIHLLDYISMDFKPPSATGLDAETTWKKHTAFLDAAHRHSSGIFVYGKLVITPTTTDEELDNVLDVIEPIDRDIPLILQPVTPFGIEDRTVSPARLIALHARASRRLDQVRVIPQTHKMIQLL